LLLTALGSSGCEAHTTVVTSIDLPEEIGPSVRSQRLLHLNVTQASSFSEKLNPPGGRCPPFDVSATPYKPGNLSQTARGFEMTRSAIPSVPEFCAAAWYDSNDDGRVDSGDAVGQIDEPYPSQPSSFLGSNRFQSPDIKLHMVP
jgi:hypothetical protein